VQYSLQQGIIDTEKPGVQMEETQYDRDPENQILPDLLRRYFCPEFLTHGYHKSVSKIGEALLDARSLES
jgi:hypothetical protein